jgi:hypothetical protein
MTQRLLHVTPTGQKSVLIDIAPDPPSMYPASKRLPLIVHEDQNLDLNLVELDKGTKAKNRAFQDRLDDVWNGIAGWEEKLKKESCDAFETITSMRDEYEKHIEKFTLSLLDEIKSVYNKFDDDLLPMNQASIQERIINSWQVSKETLEYRGILPSLFLASPLLANTHIVNYQFMF